MSRFLSASSLPSTRKGWIPSDLRRQGSLSCCLAGLDGSGRLHWSLGRDRWGDDLAPGPPQAIHLGNDLVVPQNTMATPWWWCGPPGGWPCLVLCILAAWGHGVPCWPQFAGVMTSADRAAPVRLWPFPISTCGSGRCPLAQAYRHFACLGWISGARTCLAFLADGDLFRSILWLCAASPLARLSM